MHRRLPDLDISKVCANVFRPIKRPMHMILKKNLLKFLEKVYEFVLMRNTHEPNGVNNVAMVSVIYHVCIKCGLNTEVEQTLVKCLATLKTFSFKPLLSASEQPIY